MRPSRPRSTGRPTAAPRRGLAMATTVTPTPSTRPRACPGRPSCCPAGPTRSSTCRPTRAPRSSARSGATATRASRRSTSSRSAGRRRRPARARATSPTAPTTSLPHAEARRLRRLRLGARSRPPTRCAASRTGACASTGTASRVTIPERVGDLDPTGATVVFEVVDRRLRRGLGRRRAAARARRHRRPGRRRLQRAQPRRAHARRAAGRALPDRRVRHQRPDLGLAAQLHLDAHGDARLLRRASARAARGPRPSSSSASTPASTTSSPPARALEQVAGGFEFTEGPVWSPRRRAAVQLAEHERDLPLGPARRGDRVPLQERLHGHRHRALPPARLQRPDLRPRRAAW